MAEETKSLDEIKEWVQSRMQELEPAVAEYTQLQAAWAALDAADGRYEAADPPRRRRGRPSRASGSTVRRSSRQGTGRRQAQALEIVRENPGITVKALAEQMGIGTTYLYRLMPNAERDGLVVKEGGGYRLP